MPGMFSGAATQSTSWEDASMSTSIIAIKGVRACAGNREVRDDGVEDRKWVQAMFDIAL